MLGALLGKEVGWSLLNKGRAAPARAEGLKTLTPTAFRARGLKADNPIALPSCV